MNFREWYEAPVWMLITLALIASFVMSPVSAYTFVDRGTYYTGQTVPVSELTFSLADSICQGLGTPYWSGHYASNAESNYGAWWFSNKTSVSDVFPFSNTSSPGGYYTARGNGNQFSWTGGDNPKDFVVNKTGFFNFSVVCHGYTLGYIYDAWDSSYTGYGGQNLTMPIYSYRLQNTTPPPSVVYASFNASPSFNWSAPAVITFTDTSTTSDGSSIVGWVWNVGQGYNLTGVKSVDVFFLTGGTYNISLTASNLVNSSIAYRTLVLGNATAPHATVTIEARSIVGTAPLITGATISIRNITTGAWTNKTATTGSAQFTTTDGGSMPISVGQNLSVVISSTGYQSLNDTLQVVTTPQTTDYFLTPLSMVPTNGNWNLVVTVIRNNPPKDPIYGATITVLTGVSGPGIYTGTTSNIGVASFFNISASTTAAINIDAIGYQSTSGVIPVFPNTTQHVSFELLGNGQTVSPTTVPTTAGTGGTATVSPTLTDENGNPITTNEGKANYGLDQIFNIIPLIAEMIAFAVVMWVFWRVLDAITNGMFTLILKKVIEGILKELFR
jgi:hypothetical protein